MKKRSPVYWKYSPSKSFVLNFNWILLSLTLRAFTTPLPRSNVTFCAGPRVSTTVSGDGDIAVGSIIVPLHVNCRACSANAAMLKKAMISDAIMLARNIDKAPSHLGSDAARSIDVIFLDCEIGNFDGHH